MLLHTTKKNIYGLGVGIPMVFEIIGYFLFKRGWGGGTGSPCTVMTYIPSDTTCHKKQEFVWFRGGDRNSFRNIWALPV
jgi:hypothetical protein